MNRADMRNPVCDLAPNANGRPTRRRFVGAAVALGGMLIYSRTSPAADDPAPSTDLDASVRLGLGFLKKGQATDGSLDEGEQQVLTTSRALLAFLGAGNVPDLGKYGLTVQHAVEWILAQSASDGYFGPERLGVRSHAVATLALAQVYGVDISPDQRLRIHGALSRAVAVMLAVQS